MATPAEGLSTSESLTPEAWLDMLDDTSDQECFPIVDGVIGVVGIDNNESTIDIDVAAYHAPALDLLDYPTLRQHAGVCRGLIGPNPEAVPIPAETTRVVLIVPEENNYHINANSPLSTLDAFVQVGDNETPITILRFKLPDHTYAYDYWLRKNY
ncbi:MAG TPA: hypothetical protein VMQ52_03370 [Candidatus Saccharimonadales bacterium]|jgi:hypothetical protein|nr:hypothetical protein [Candidatus Saccharimonadales bacterium]